MLVVPNKQMEDFIFIMDLNPDGVSFDSEPFAVGNKVKVIKGILAALKVRLLQRRIKLMLLFVSKVF